MKTRGYIGLYKAYIGVYRGLLAYTGSAAHIPSSLFRACLFVLLFLVGSFRRGFGGCWVEELVSSHG